MRKIVWDGIDKQGRRMIDQAFPLAMREGRPNDAEMKMRFQNGSMWQCVGSDNYDSLVGANPIGVVFTEYSLADPAAWDYIRPILAENGGWALFIFTPRGPTHGKRLYEMAKKSDSWYCDLLTVKDTGVISEEVVEQERQDGMSDEMVDQEFYCSFEGIREGSYYGKLMRSAEKEGRITRVPYDPVLEVHTFWDLGVTNAIWFMQQCGREWRAIDYEHGGHEGIPGAVRVLKSKDYVYGTHMAPHDAEAKDVGTGMSRIEIAQQLGVRFKVAPRLSVDDGIEAVRGMLPRVWFDSEKCEKGLDALKSYRRLWDEKKKMYLDTPYHDWASHGADAMRYFAVSHRSIGTQKWETLQYPNRSYV